MAFTESQKVTLRLLLGYPDVFRQHNPRLEGVFATIGARPDTQTAIEDLLTKIATIEPQIASLLGTAGLKRAEEVEWFQAFAGSWSAPQEAVATVGRMYIARISRLMGVPVLGDYFGTQGFPGDWFMAPSNQTSGGGLIPLG